MRFSAASASAKRPRLASQRGDFRQHRSQRNGDQRRDGADHEHPLPAPIWHDVDADERTDRQADREHDLRRKRKATAALSLGEFIDISRHQGNFAAKADALDEAQPPHLVVGRGEGASEAAQCEDQQGDDHRIEPAPALAEPAECDRADELAGEADRDQRSDHCRNLRPGQMPNREQRGQDVGDGDRIESVEEPCAADDDAHVAVPGRVGQSLEPRCDLAHVAGRANCRCRRHEIVPPRRPRFVSVAASIPRGADLAPDDIARSPLPLSLSDPAI